MARQANGIGQRIGPKLSPRKIGQEARLKLTATENPPVRVASGF